MKWLDGIPIFVAGLPDEPEQSDDVILNTNDTSDKDDEEVILDLSEKTEKTEESEEVKEEELDDDGNKIEKKDDDDEDEDEDELINKDDIQIHERPTLKEIKTKYPEIFKDFPDLKEALFRDRKYSEIFPTIEDAQEAQSSSTSYDEMSNLLFSGDPEDLNKFLESMKEGSKDSIQSMAVNFLPILYKQDEGAYFDVIHTVIENAIKNVYKEGVNADRENVRNAAILFSRIVFGDDDIASTDKRMTRHIKIDSESKVTLNNERKEMKDQRYIEVKDNVVGRCSKTLKKEILKGMTSNDISDDLKEILVDRIQQEVGTFLNNNENHMKIMNSLWKKGYNAGFVGDWEARLTSAYLARAKSVMPAIRNKIVSKVTKTSADDSRNKMEIISGSNRREIHGSGKASKSVVKSVTDIPDNKIDWGRTSDLDYFNERVTLKK